MYEVVIEPAENGFIVTNSYGCKIIQSSLDELFSYLLACFESRTVHGTGEYFGKVIVVRQETQK